MYVAKGVPVLFEIDGAGGGFAFEVGVVDEHRRNVGDNFFEPGCWNFFPKQEHGL
jgi:hypothetical protein